MFAAIAVLAASFAFVQRLTRIEDAVKSNTQLVTGRIDGLTLQVGKQNGRIGQLESWQQRALAVIGLVVFLAPFVFYAMTQTHHMP